MQINILFKNLNYATDLQQQLNWSNWRKKTDKSEQTVWIIIHKTQYHPGG